MTDNPESWDPPPWLGRGRFGAWAPNAGRATHLVQLSLAAAILALALPCAADSAVYTDPAGDVGVWPATAYSGPVSEVVDLLQVELRLENQTLYVTIHVENLERSAESSMTGDLMHIAGFSVFNSTSEVPRRVRSDRGYWITGGLTEVPPPWEFIFQSDPYDPNTAQPINGTVDEAGGLVVFEVPVALLNVTGMVRLGNFSATAQQHTPEVHINDWARAPDDLFLNLPPQATNSSAEPNPPTRPENPSTSPSTSPSGQSTSTTRPEGQSPTHTDVFTTRSNSSTTASRNAVASPLVVLLALGAVATTTRRRSGVQEP